MKNLAKALFAETLFRNSVYLMLSTGTMALFGFVFWLLVAHLYKASQVGIAATLISSMNFIAYLSLLGFNSTFIRFLPKSKSRNEQIDTGLVLVALAAIISSGVFVLVAPEFAPKLDLLHNNLFYGLGFIILSLGATINLITDSIFIAYRSAVYNFFIDGLAGSSVQLLLPLVLISLGAFGIYAAQGVAAVVAMILSIIFLIKKFSYKPQVKINKPILRNVLHYSSGNYLASLLNTVPTIVLPIIVLNVLGAAPAGYYYLAFMMANVLFAVSYAVAQSLFAEGSHDEQKLKMLTLRAAKFLAVIVVPASILLALLGPLLLDFFGHAYETNSRQLIIVLALSGPVMAAVGLCSIVMRVKKLTKELNISNLVYTVVTCSAALLWAHKGLPWVGGAWLVGQSVTLILMMSILVLRSKRIGAS